MSLPRSLPSRVAALLILLPAAACARHVPSSAASAQAPPRWMLGTFRDDYDSRHTITAHAWTQEGYATYRVARWNVEGDYLVARNDAGNREDAGKWTRIDWMRLEGMPPYEWGYCISTWNAATPEEAEAAAGADRSTPRTGCGGHPFTRMKRAERAERP